MDQDHIELTADRPTLTTAPNLYDLLATPATEHTLDHFGESAYSYWMWVGVY